jgi:hypothetical protein
MTETRRRIKEEVLNLLRFHIEGLLFNEIFRKLPIHVGKPTLSIVLSEMVKDGDLEKQEDEGSKLKFKPQRYKLGKLSPIDHHMVETEQQLTKIRPSKAYLKSISKVDRRLAIYNYLNVIDHLIRLNVLYYAFQSSKHFDISPKDLETIIIKTAKKAQDVIVSMEDFGQEENLQLFHMLTSLRLESPFMLTTKLNAAAPPIASEEYEKRQAIENALEPFYEKMSTEMEAVVQKALKDAGFADGKKKRKAQTVKPS